MKCFPDFCHMIWPSEHSVTSIQGHSRPLSIFSGGPVKEGKGSRGLTPKVCCLFACLPIYLVANAHIGHVIYYFCPLHVDWFHFWLHLSHLYAVAVSLLLLMNTTCTAANLAPIVSLFPLLLRKVNHSGSTYAEVATKMSMNLAFVKVPRAMVNKTVKVAMIARRTGILSTTYRTVMAAIGSMEAMLMAVNPATRCRPSCE